jgi:hypothetical protein
MILQSSALVRKGQKGEPCLSLSRKHRGDFMHYKIPGKWDPTKKMMLSTCKTMKFLVLGFKLVEFVCCSLVTQARIWMWRAHGWVQICRMYQTTVPATKHECLTYSTKCAEWDSHCHRDFNML